MSEEKEVVILEDETVAAIDRVKAELGKNQVKESAEFLARYGYVTYADVPTQHAYADSRGACGLCGVTFSKHWHTVKLLQRAIARACGKSWSNLTMDERADFKRQAKNMLVENSHGVARASFLNG